MIVRGEDAKPLDGLRGPDPALRHRAENPGGRAAAAENSFGERRLRLPQGLKLQPLRGLRSYLYFRRGLAAANLREFGRLRDESGIPIPPARLRHRVHGDLDIDRFLQVGRQLRTDLDTLLRLAGRSIYSFRDILDFGCGAGRVLRNLSDAPSSCRLHGTDIDRALVKWCQRNLPWASFTTNAAVPPAPFADDSFDLIYGISVFTHLDEEYQNRWLAELSRIARLDALLILSVHGEHAAAALTSAQQEEIQRDGFFHLVALKGRLKLDGLPDFYQTTFHSREYVEREWSRYFKVLHYVPRGINDHQDAVILRNALPRW